MSKSSKIIAVLSVFFLIFSIILSISIYKKKEISGRMWFDCQQEYIGNIQETAKQLDTITSLYLNGNINSEDYYNHLCIIKTEYNILHASYEENSIKYPVKVGSYDFYTKSGCESVAASMNIMSNLIDSCINSREDKDKLIYTYLAYSQELSKEFAGYTTAYAVIYYEDITASNTDAESEVTDE